MTKSEAMQLMELHDHRYTIIINDHSYVDSSVRSIELSEDDDDIVYSSAVFDDRSLLTVDKHSVKVFQPVKDWEHITPTLQEIL